MKSIINFILLVTGMSLVLTACDKADALPSYGKGSASTLSASTTTIATAPVDSNKAALVLRWTYPNYATDTANIKYTIEIDSTGKNFSKPYVREVIGQDSVAFTGKELNNILLARGYAFNVPVDMDVRLTTSYANNNERIVANTLKIRMTPYKVPPKVPLPTTSRVFIVGDATDFGWSNDATPPFPAAREFSRIDETTWVGIFNLKGSGGYKLLEKQGEWSSQYHMLNGGTATAGSFEKRDADPGFPSPATAGLYKITLDFQAGTYKVEPFTQQHGLPSNLFIVGSATAGDWSNPVPLPSQQFTRKNSTEFELTLPLLAAKQYLLLPENGNWDKKFGTTGDASNTKLTGTFKPQGENIDGPDQAGTYKITVNFADNTYKLVKQ
jgi:starch-binding outer membrane protein SusE/F